MKSSWLLLPLMIAGCSAARHVAAPLAEIAVLPSYRIGCPDLLELSFSEHSEQNAVATVDVDGRLNLPGIGKPRVEGLTVTEAAAAIAALAEYPEGSVAVKVLEPRSARVSITGPSNSRTRFLPYAGPEPVLDYLRRTDSIPPKASRLSRVYVLRSNVAAGTPPRLFHVDVEAILIDGNPATNLPLEPGDRIYIGETPRSSLARLLPDWAMPMYRRIVGLLPEALRP